MQIFVKFRRAILFCFDNMIHTPDTSANDVLFPRDPFIKYSTDTKKR